MEVAKSTKSCSSKACNKIHRPSSKNQWPENVDFENISQAMDKTWVNKRPKASAHYTKSTSYAKDNVTLPASLYTPRVTQTLGNQIDLLTKCAFVAKHMAFSGTNTYVHRIFHLSKGWPKCHEWTVLWKVTIEWYSPPTVLEVPNK